MTNGVLFDLDGTLVDTPYMHTVSWWQALRQFEHDVEMARIHRSIGMGSDRILDHLLGPEHDTSDDDRIRAAHSSLYAQYWQRLRANRGAKELLQEVAGRGLRVVLASSAGRPELEAMLRALDADDYIDTVVGLDDAGASKPAPDIVERALERGGLAADQVVFVGDSVWDVYACEALAIPCVGLTCGGISEAELREAGAVRVYENPRAMLDALDEAITR
jgi:HAD superfamily hydrolase (TIGR01549 family)